ncbi:hypothetical protein ACFE04_007975 [Oxalis oulophora]
MQKAFVFFALFVLFLAAGSNAAPMCVTVKDCEALTVCYPEWKHHCVEGKCICSHNLEEAKSKSLACKVDNDCTNFVCLGLTSCVFDQCTCLGARSTLRLA